MANYAGFLLKKNKTKQKIPPKTKKVNPSIVAFDHLSMHDSLFIRDPVIDLYLYIFLFTSVWEIFCQCQWICSSQLQGLNVMIHKNKT